MKIRKKIWYLGEFSSVFGEQRKINYVDGKCSQSFLLYVKAFELQCIVSKSFYVIQQKSLCRGNR